MSSESVSVVVVPSDNASLVHAMGVFLHRLFYWTVVHCAYGMAVRPVVVWWCEHVRPYPIPSGPAASSSTSRLLAPDGEMYEGGSKGLVSLLCGDRVAHNEHIGLLVHPREVLEVKDELEERRVGQAGRFPYTEVRGPLSIKHHRPFQSLTEATRYATEKGLLLVVLVHSELNRLSRTLLAEIIGHDTCNIQRCLGEKVAFYLTSALGGECGQLSGLLGVSLPAVVVYAPKGEERHDEDSANVQSTVPPPPPQPVMVDPREAARAAVLRRLANNNASKTREEDTTTSQPHEGDTSVYDVSSSSTSWKRYPLPGMEPISVPYVASMEGVSSVGDMYGFLLECEKQYTEW